jgi:hypothetical protein
MTGQVHPTASGPFQDPAQHLATVAGCAALDGHCDHVERRGGLVIDARRAVGN